MSRRGWAVVVALAVLVAGCTPIALGGLAVIIARDGSTGLPQQELMSRAASSGASEAQYARLLTAASDEQVPWQLLAALLSVQTGNGRSVPGETAQREPLSVAVADPPIVVEEQDQTWAGPFLVDADAADAAGLDAQHVERSALYLADLLHTAVEADDEWSGVIGSGWHTIEADRAVWMRAVESLPVRGVSTAAPAPLTIRSCAADPVTVVTDRPAGYGAMPGVTVVTVAGLADVPAVVTGVAGRVVVDLHQAPDPAVVDVAGVVAAVQTLAPTAQWALPYDPAIARRYAEVVSTLLPAPDGVVPPVPDPHRAGWVQALDDAGVSLLPTTDRWPDWIGLDPVVWPTGEIGYPGLASAVEARSAWLAEQLCPRVPAPVSEAAISTPSSSALARTVVDLAIAWAAGERPAAGVCLAPGAVLPADAEQIIEQFAGGHGGEQRTVDTEAEARMLVALRAFSAAGFAGDELIVVGALAGRESSWRPDAYNGNRATGDDSYGLLQINTIQESVWSLMRSELGFSRREDLFDPVNNARAARWLYNRSAAVPFFAWGPYRGDPPLHGGAETYVAAVYRVALANGLITGTDDGPMVADATTTTTPTTTTTTLPAAATAPSVGCVAGDLEVPPTIEGLLTWAQSMIGSPYAAINPYRFGTQLWPGGSLISDFIDRTYNFPVGTRVFDCSGFVVAAYRQIGVDLLAMGAGSSAGVASSPHLIRLSSMAELRAGDLITYTPSEEGIGHVVIWLGEGDLIIDAGPAVGVSVRPVDMSRVAELRRVPLPQDVVALV